MRLKSFLLGLVLSKILASVGTALIAAHFDQEITFLQYFIVLTMMGTSSGILCQILLFCIYFFSVKYLAERIRSTKLFYLFLFIHGIMYFTIILLIDWIISKGAYKSFENYIYHGNYYLIYMIAVILVLAITGVGVRFVRDRTS